MTHRPATLTMLMLAALMLPGIASAEMIDPNRFVPIWWFLIPATAIAALVTAFQFYQWIMKAAEGTPEMVEIAGHVREGAYAYLRRQYYVVGIFFAVVFVLLLIMALGLEVQHWLVPFAFITSGFFSGLAGFFGMKTATSAASRTAQAASQSLSGGLRVAFRGGAVMGLTVVGLALLDNSFWFLYLYAFHHHIFGGDPMSLETITMVMLCFGMGASSQALFARVGGGIYTKAADVGADLVGKVEAGIPEDDPRNPATIADNVGDNVGDVAGMGADLYESYAGAILATSALGVAAALSLGREDMMFNYLVAPAFLAAIGIISSIVGVYMVQGRDNATMSELLHSLDRGIHIACGFVIGGAFIFMMLLGMPISVLISIAIGLALGIVIGKGTEWATASEYKATQGIADNAQFGPATLIIGGIAEGMLSTWIPIVAVSTGMLVSFSVSGGFEDFLSGLFGIGMAAVGMLSTLGITLATDAYGPISDNAGGIAEMAEMDPEVRERTDKLDALGNTTAAIGKGFAIGSAALTALALLASYVESVRIAIHREAAAAYVITETVAQEDGMIVNDIGNGKFGIYVQGSGTEESKTISAFISDRRGSMEVQVTRGPSAGMIVPVVVNQVGSQVPSNRYLDVNDRDLTEERASLDDFMGLYDITLTNPKVLVGLFAGVLMVFIFSALTMKAVGRAASAMVDEVRRQFREKPGIMDYSEKPDYARCVQISTAGAQKEMVLPSVLALVIPIGVGLLLDVSGVMGLLAGVLTGGFAVAIFMANAGGAWDNAKKYVEAGAHGGKGSDAHKAAVVGDTVGDPFKDTSGPSLNILIKLTSIVSIVFVGLIVKFAPAIGAMIGLN